MMMYYGVAGIFANIAMLVNVLVVVAVMAMFGATLTLPGMAGLVLTVGMAVDANVIINERIRELLRDGVNIRASIEQGYKNAMSAIIDSNITSLVTSVALYAYGTGAVKGFAVTLGIGIVVSMITAILGTHGMFDYFMQRIEKVIIQDFGLAIGEDNAVFSEKKIYDFMRMRFAAISLSFILFLVLFICFGIGVCNMALILAEEL